MSANKACPLLLQDGKLLWFRHPPADSHPLYHRALAEARRRLADVPPPLAPGGRERI